MLPFIGSAPLILKRQELESLYTAEDAIQIYHAKSSTLEFFAAKVPKAAACGRVSAKKILAGSGNITVTILL